ncbi:hypothetical protein WP1_064 [Pseudomonas phage WP1]
MASLIYLVPPGWSIVPPYSLRRAILATCIPTDPPALSGYRAAEYHPAETDLPRTALNTCKCAAISPESRLRLTCLSTPHRPTSCVLVQTNILIVSYNQCQKLGGIRTDDCRFQMPRWIVRHAKDEEVQFLTH